MRSLETRRHRDLDMPEHAEGSEVDWDKLANTPFAGDQDRLTQNSIDNTNDLKDLIDSLPDSENELNSTEKERLQNIDRGKKIFEAMDSVGSFGRNARNNKVNEVTTSNSEEELDSSYKDLSDISSTF